MVFLHSCLMMIVAVFLMMSQTSAVHLNEYFDQLDLVKKSQCVSTAGDCYNTEQCCSGFTCVASSERGDSLETPGQCVKSKDLKTCRSVEDCYVSLGSEAGDTLHCAPLNSQSPLGDASQRYCVHRARITSSSVESDQTGRAINGPRKHQAYSRVLANIAGSCETDADCQTYNSNTNVRLCCQQVSQGRQGVRRICDRVTTISVCIPPPVK